MSEKASILSGNAVWVAGIVVAMGASVFALVSTGALDGSDPAPSERSVEAPQQETEAPSAPVETVVQDETQPVEAVPSVTATEEPVETEEPLETEATPSVDAPPTAETSEDTETAVVAEQSAEDVAVPVVSPTFDLVRVDAEGNTVIAGAATPNAMLGILLDGAEIALAPTDTSGKFAAILTIEPSEAPRVLSLVERRDDGDIPSDATVIVAPILAVTASVVPSEESAVALSSDEIEARVDDGDSVVETAVNDIKEVVEPVVKENISAVQGDVDAATSELETAVAVPNSNETATDVESVAQEQAKVATAPKAPAVIVSDSDGVRVVQPAAPVEATPELLAAVSIDSISYTDTGAVMVSGRGNAGLFVRLYLDNTLAAESAIADAGLWSSELTDVAGGLYELRADEVDKTGKVISRVVTPFKRETPETVALARAQADEAATTQAEEEPADESVQTPPAQETQLQTATQTETPASEVKDTVVAAEVAPTDPAPVEITAEPVAEATEEPSSESVAQTADAPKAAEGDVAVSAPKAPAVEAARTAGDGAATAPVIAAVTQPDTTPAEAPAAVRIVTVQPGSSLWAIARDRYGEGQFYLRVFEANQDKIRDPDLIYPGQVFTVPEE
ncbi:LysM peptidoglycan-binding domain-containing protein [Shimia sp.]|uniref:LysM peptidoglycan-binding domain-containing protein n=1 Tax=Shimia sp. TaxID=1954381 RepID=UPI003BA85F58